MTPALSDVYEMTTTPKPGTWVWWLGVTPLHAAWAGPEAVYVFFVLSGTVLTLSAMRAGYDWFAYFPRRLIRLYVPVWAAVALAALSMALITRMPEAQGSTWLSRRDIGYDAEHLRTDLTLLFGGTDPGLSPLWSLRWEVWFSLLLPLFVLLAVAAPRWWWAKIAVTGAVLVLGTVMQWPEARYLAMFAAGVLIAAHWDTLREMMTRVLRIPGAGFMLLLITILAFTSRWLSFGISGSSSGQRWWSIAVVVSAVLAVLLAAHWGPARRFLEWAPVHWLGTISFSLYLVHETVVVSVRYLLLDAPMTLVAAIAIPLSLLIAWLFYLAVERPATRLSRRAGKAASNRVRPVEERQPPQQPP